MVSISNIYYDSNILTFDLTTFDEVGETELTVSALENGIQFTEVYPLKINNLLQDMDDIYIGINSSETITIPFYNNGILPDSVSITSGDNSILSVSNIQFDLDSITCDINSYEIQSETYINISIIHCGRTYTQNVLVSVITGYYSVDSLGSAYGFTLGSDDYYESTNKGVGSSYAICRLNITAMADCKLYLDCINYAEYGYDYGLLSNLDTELTLSYVADSSDKVYQNFKNLSYPYIQTVSYDIPEGKHFIDIKFRKDNYGNSNNDSLKFKVRLE